MHFNVIVIGCGFSGIHCAQVLAKLGRQSDIVQRLDELEKIRPGITQIWDLEKFRKVQ